MLVKHLCRSKTRLEGCSSVFSSSAFLPRRQSISAAVWGPVLGPRAQRQGHRSLLPHQGQRHPEIPEATRSAHLVLCSGLSIELARTPAPMVFMTLLWSWGSLFTAHCPVPTPWRVRTPFHGVEARLLSQQLILPTEEETNMAALGSNDPRENIRLPKAVRQDG